MARKLKLERDDMGTDIINRKIGEIKEETEKTEELGEQYMRDQDTLDRLLKSIEESTLPEEVKEKQRNTLNNSKRILYNHYKKEVQDKMDELNKESEDLIEKVKDTAQETQEHIDEMNEAKIETGTVTLDESIITQKEYFDYLEKIKTDEAEELSLRQQQAEIMRRYMNYGKGR
jgi:hypothetical protein